MYEILEPEDLFDYRDAYERELYRFDEDGNERTDQEIIDYLADLAWSIGLDRAEEN